MKNFTHIAMKFSTFYELLSVNFSQDKTGLLLFRIMFPLLLSLKYILTYDVLDSIFSSNGILNLEIRQFATSNNPIYNIDFLMNRDNFIYLFIIISLFVSLGFLTRISSFLLLFLSAYFLNKFSFFNYGVDYIAQIFLLILLLLPAGRYNSLDNFIFKFKSQYSRIEYYNLIRIALGIIYFFGGLGKVLGENWWNGHSIWKALCFGSYFTNIDYSLLTQFPALLIVSGIFIAIFELLYPLLVYINRTRKVAVYIIVSMHFFIGYFMGLYYFSLVLIFLNIIAYPQFFIPKKKINDT